MFQFQKTHTFEERKKESERIRYKYPDRVPIIVEKNPKNNIPDIDKHKFLVPNDLTVGQFMFVIRKRIKLLQEQAIFLFINRSIPVTSDLVSNVYKIEKNDDGFLYIMYSGENSFG